MLYYLEEYFNIFTPTFVIKSPALFNNTLSQHGLAIVAALEGTLVSPTLFSLTHNLSKTSTLHCHHSCHLRAGMTGASANRCPKFTWHIERRFKVTAKV